MPPRNPAPGAIILSNATACIASLCLLIILLTALLIGQISQFLAYFYIVHKANIAVLNQLIVINPAFLLAAILTELWILKRRIGSTSSLRSSAVCTYEESHFLITLA